MTTIKQFQTNPYAKSWQARILSVSGNRLVLDQTIFAPEAGGQSCDLGAIRLMDTDETASVTYVGETNGILEHTADSLSPGFVPGAKVLLSLDWARRFDHMQNHLAEHILSGILYSRFHIGNKGFHLGASLSTLDADTPDLSPEQLSQLEDQANQVIFQALPVEIRILEKKEDANAFPLRKPLKVEEDISVVTIPGVDCVACCCPHPATTAEVGLVKILRAEHYKGMTRVTFVAGARALSDYQAKHRIVSQLNRQFSADEATLLDKIRIQAEKAEKTKQSLYAMKEVFSKDQALRLLKKQREASLANGRQMPVTGHFPELSLDDLKRIAKYALKETDQPVILSTDQSFAVFLTHSGKSSLRCGQIVREFAVGFGGKGGGSDTQAQALFREPSLRDNFIDILLAQLKALA